MIEDGTADPEARVTRERRLSCRLVFAERVQEAERSPCHEVVEIGGRGHTSDEPTRNLAHERQVALQRHLLQAVLRARAQTGARRIPPDVRYERALVHTICPPRWKLCRRRYPIGRA